MEKDNDSSASMASFCPSFSSYTGDRLAETADRVALVVSGESDGDRREESGVSYSGGDDAFEFVNLQLDAEAAAMPGNKGFLFPVFDQNLVGQTCGVQCDGKNDDEPLITVTTPQRDPFLRDRHRDDPPPPMSSSSSDEEEDELEGIPCEIYCSWTPARSTVEISPSGGCRKSRSTGSSSTSTWALKRWWIRDLLRRSRSDGKESLGFLNSNSASHDIGANRDEFSKKKKEKVNEKGNKKEKVSAHEKFYLRNKATKEEGKRKSYLPYKQDLVGLFINSSGYGKTSLRIRF